jgi:hypothetical protein
MAAHTRSICWCSCVPEFSAIPPDALLMASLLPKHVSDGGHGTGVMPTEPSSAYHAPSTIRGPRERSHRHGAMTGAEQWTVFAWIRLAHLIRTQCSFNSVPDFVFAAGTAQRWGASSEILATGESYCPSDQHRSDHRPVLAQFQLSGNGQPSARELLLAHIQRLEAELSSLKTMVERMPQ